VGGSREDGRWLEDALRPIGLPVSVQTLAEALRPGRTARPSVHPDVVVLHERRRREDLLDALDRIRAHPALAGAPLVVVDHERDVLRFTAALSRGAAACVCPPLDPAQLRATVARLARWRDDAASGERRDGGRRPLLIRMDVRMADGTVLGGLLRDVSATGCRLETPAAVPPGTTVSLTPYGYDDSLEFRIGATVRRHAEIAPGVHQLACRFSGTGAVMAPRLFAVLPLAARAAG
jgi:CheY-like chemotaxis protein